MMEMRLHNLEIRISSIGG